RYCRQ
ncbi:hypothetical protein V3C99_005076, partial [Haemonchus contortus]